MRSLPICLLVTLFAACNNPKPPAPEDYVDRLTQARHDKDIQLQQDAEPVPAELKPKLRGTEDAREVRAG
jgi:hypothetical protein